MSVAVNTTTLKKRVDDYLWREPSMPMVKLRGIINEHFMSFGRVAIIGGLVRDLARKGRAGFRSDIDIVVHGPAAVVADLARNLKATPNRFGGYAYHHPQWKIDFWALESTWASTSGNATVDSIGDLTRCTFFDWDAVLYELHDRSIICSDSYLEKLKTNQIEINLLPNPSIHGNLLRAIRRIFLWNVQPGPCLTNFITNNLDESSFEAISRTERTLYQSVVLPEFGSIENLLFQLRSLDSRTRFDTSFGRQMTFPGF